MKILADESVDAPIVLSLRDGGHEVASIAEDSWGLPDEAVLQRAWQEGVLLITADKDFGELVYRQHRQHAGVLLLRLEGLDEATKCELVTRVIAERGQELSGAFSVLSANDLRIRRDPTL